MTYWRRRRRTQGLKVQAKLENSAAPTSSQSVQVPAVGTVTRTTPIQFGKPPEQEAVDVGRTTDGSPSRPEPLLRVRKSRLQDFRRRLSAGVVPAYRMLFTTFTTLEAVKPNFSNRISAGADAPKPVMPITAPSRPTHSYHG